MFRLRTDHIEIKADVRVRKRLTRAEKLVLVLLVTFVLTIIAYMRGGI